MSITEFLLARIAEDEADLKRWEGMHGAPDWAKEDYNFGGTDDYQQVTMGYGRALAECAAKRAIINGTIPERDPQAGNPDYDPLWVVRELAAVYKDHPDYQQEWDLGG